MKRRLTTIMIGDIVGSTAQMEADEESSVHRFNECLNAVGGTVGAHEGRVFNRAGDAVLAEFQSPVNALRAAMTARGKLGSIAKDAAPQMRFGLHLADIVEVDGDLRGDGVNLAARIQSAAEPGAIEASGALFDQVKRNSPCTFDELGERTFSGISEPIRVYRVRDQMGPHRMQVSETHKVSVQQERRPHSIAVIPLSTASSSTDDQRFLAEGMTEDLILELGRLHQLFVSSSTACMGLAGRDPISVGSDLGVRYVLTGSMRTLGSRLRLNLTLAETERGEAVWSDRIQRPFEEFVDMIDDVAAKVAGTVLGRVIDADTKVARMKPPDSLSAYEYYLRGLDYHRLGGVTDANIREAMHWFEKAIEADPTFGRAQAMWVCSASGLADYDWDDGRERTARAVELDPSDPEANRIMGSILMHERKFEHARAYHEKALKMAPNNAYIVGRCAAFHIFAGEPEMALELLDRAAELDPYLPPWITQERVAALYCLDRFPDVVSAARDIAFQTKRSRIYRAAAHVALDDEKQAQKVIREARAASPELDANFVRSSEFYQDRDVLKLLIDRLERAGLNQNG